MHSMIIVIGDDPIDQLAVDDIEVWNFDDGTTETIPRTWQRSEFEAHLESGQAGPDWFGIGGRFQGALTTWLGEKVDQARADEIDWNASARGGSPRAVVINGTWHDSQSVVSPEELGAVMAYDLQTAVGGSWQPTPKVQSDAERGYGKLGDWAREVFWPAIALAEASAALITVVDVHD